MWVINISSPILDACGATEEQRRTLLDIALAYRYVCKGTDGAGMYDELCARVANVEANAEEEEDSVRAPAFFHVYAH